MRPLGVVRDALAEAWGELWRARLRTLLAVAGVAVGAAALSFPVFVYHVEATLHARARKNDWFTITVPSASSDPLLRRRPHLVRDKLLPADAEAIRRQCSSVERLVVWGVLRTADCKAGRRWCKASIESTDAVRSDDLRSNNTCEGLAWGRPFTSVEIARGDRVVIINNEMKRELFGNDSLDGASVRIDGVPFAVIGVAKDRGPRDRFPYAWMPYTCAQDLYWDTYWSFRGRPRADAREQAFRGIDAILFARLGDPGESYVSWGGAVSASESRMFAFLGLIGMLTLLSAGIAVSNKCYVDVLGRIDEIALRRALGATAHRIYGTVLLESGLLCGLGCVMGGGLALLALTVIIARVPANLRPEVGFPVLPLAGMLLFTVSLGIAAGLQAAAIAAKAPPAEALTRKDIV